MYLFFIIIDIRIDVHREWNTCQQSHSQTNHHRWSQCPSSIKSNIRWTRFLLLGISPVLIPPETLSTGWLASPWDLALSLMKPVPRCQRPLGGRGPYPLHSPYPSPSLCPYTQHNNYHAQDEALILLLIHQPADENSTGSNTTQETGRSLLHRCETRLSSGTIGV